MPQGELGGTNAGFGVGNETHPSDLARQSTEMLLSLAEQGSSVPESRLVQYRGWIEDARAHVRAADARLEAAVRGPSEANGATVGEVRA